MADRLNIEKTYVLGLLVGGGTISSNTFQIALPLDVWGMEPQRMSVIARDLLTQVQSRFKRAYLIDVKYEIGNRRWLIRPVSKVNIQQIVRDLIYLRLPSMGDILNRDTDLAIVKKKLSKLQTEGFLTGIFDARASLTESHRRFSDEAPVVSIEVPGKTQNFKFVVQLCSWLTELGSITDQILYNHPCQHSASNPFYKGWKKGFKIRFLVKSFIKKHSFVLKSKAFDAGRLESRQIKKQQLPCLERKPRTISSVCIHENIISADLPDSVRG